MADLYADIPLAGAPVTLVRSTTPPKPSYGSSRTPKSPKAGCLAEEWIRKHMTRSYEPLSSHEILKRIAQVDHDQGLAIDVHNARFPEGVSRCDVDQRGIVVRTPGLVALGATWILFGDQSAALIHDAYGKEGLIYPLAFRIKHPKRTDKTYSFRVSTPCVQQKGDLYLSFKADKRLPGEPHTYSPTHQDGYLTVRLSFLDARLLGGRMEGCLSKSARSATSKSDRTLIGGDAYEALKIWSEAMTRTAEILLQGPERINLLGVAQRLYQSKVIH
jgi:hypothetical protein